MVRPGWWGLDGEALDGEGGEHGEATVGEEMLRREPSCSPGTAVGSNLNTASSSALSVRSRTARQREGRPCKRHRCDFESLCPPARCSALCPLLAKRIDTSHQDGCKGRRTRLAVCAEHPANPAAGAAWVTYCLLII